MKLLGRKTKMEKELSDKVLKMMRQLGDMPIMETYIYPSKDNKYIIHEIRMKMIKPIGYYDAIIKEKNRSYYKEVNQKGGNNDRRY